MSLPLSVLVELKDMEQSSAYTLVVERELQPLQYTMKNWKRKFPLVSHRFWSHPPSSLLYPYWSPALPWQVDPLAPPLASEPVTQPRLNDKSARLQLGSSFLQLIWDHYSYGFTWLPQPSGLALVTCPSACTMDLWALHPSTPLAPLGFTFPLASPWSSGTLASPWMTITAAPPRSPDPVCRLDSSTLWLHLGFHLQQLHLSLSSPWVYRPSLHHGSSLLWVPTWLLMHSHALLSPSSPPWFLPPSSPIVYCHLRAPCPPPKPSS